MIDDWFAGFVVGMIVSLVICLIVFNLPPYGSQKCSKEFPYSRTKVIDFKCHRLTDFGWILDSKTIYDEKDYKQKVCN